MNVLICDNDAPTRFVLKRILTQNLGWSSVEAEDGIDALSKLSTRRFDLMLLDLDMPSFDGFEVLEVVRQSPTLQHLPVVIVSQERRREVVARLKDYKVSGYMLKPVRAEQVAARLTALGLRAMAHYGIRGDVSSLFVSPDHPTLVIDGNKDFRQFFVAEAEKYGPIRAADSAAAGLAAFRGSQVDVVFVGTKLGVMGTDMLLRKLRDTAAGRHVRIVGVVEGSGHANGHARLSDDRVTGGFDDRMVRTCSPTIFAAEFQRFIRKAGPVAALSRLLPEFLPAAANAVAQVFGTRFGAEAQRIPGPVDMNVALQSTVDMDFGGELRVAVTIHLSEAAAAEVSRRGIADDASEADRGAVATELASSITCRLQAYAEERLISSDCSLRETQAHSTAQPLPGVTIDGGHLLFFQTPEEAPFAVSLLVTEPELALA
jgi:two-component system chemotaxis response regulator CheY